MEPSTSISNNPTSSDKVADLAIISYEKLLHKDEAEAANLLHACTEAGFFYLDLRGTGSKGYLEVVNDIFGLSKDYFAKPLEEKLNDTNKDDISVFNICG
jgi:isopenicillin N synthase-like dioxygenase